MPSIYHDRDSYLWSSDVANALAYRMGVVMHFSKQRLTCCTNAFLLFLARSEAKMVLDQCRINPLTTGYKYANSIRVSDIIDLSAPSYGLGKRYKKKMYAISKCYG